MSTEQAALGGEHASGSARTSAAGLKRAITGLTNGAITYACAGITAGIFSLFAFALESSGPAFFWGWLIVGASLLLACLNYAELASHYPFAASIYHWPLQLAGRRAGWWVGWLYLGALLSLLPAYTIVMPAVLSPLFGFAATHLIIVMISVGFILVAMLLNLLGIDVLGRLTVAGVAAELLVLFVLSVLVFAFGPHHSPAVLFSSAGTGSTFTGWLPGFVGGGIFVGLWALFTFETAGTLGEETIDAKRQAPRAILGALGMSVLAGTVFLFFFLLSIPNLGAAMKSATPVQDIISNSLSGAMAKVYLIVIAWTLFMAINTLFTAMTRHIFGMARAGMLPFSRSLARTLPDGEPWVAAIVIAVLTSLPLIIITQNLTVLVTGAIAAIYVPYVLVLGITLYARLRGWPKTAAPFRLGRWGIPVNALALAAAVLTLIDLVWPRVSTNPVWKLNIRVSYWLVGIPLVIGMAYYAARVHGRLARSSDLELESLPVQESAGEAPAVG
ncbi:MAG TPA: APC family permease [Streptosporangiaceae bacterium]|nr:APC family permease [Streptosporangiaceae bacterium]